MTSPENHLRQPVLASQSSSDSSQYSSSSLESWIQTQFVKSLSQMFMNVSYDGELPGSVVASPSRTHPDYFYHWIRDAALVMDTVVSAFGQAQLHSDRLIYPINSNTSLGVAMGRYPEDIYDGYEARQTQGNPWILATLGYAELCYCLAEHWQQVGVIQVTARNRAFLEDLTVASGKRWELSGLPQSLDRSTHAF